MAMCSAYNEELYLSEPEAPTLSLGSRVIWNGNCGSKLGTLRWVGRIPQLYQGWTVGIEFDEPVPNGGNGRFNRKQYFLSHEQHALFLPACDIVSAESATTFEGDRNCTKSNNLITHVNHRVSQNRHTHCFTDSTYSCCKHNCVCSVNSRCGCLRDMCCSDHDPVHNCIISRQITEQQEHPFESCVNNHSIQSHPVYHKLPYNMCSSHQNDIACFPSTSSNKSQKLSENSYTYINQISSSNLPCKDSYFTPRATIELISGLKDWLTCWVMGTSRQKRKSNIVLKRRRTIPSLMMTNEAQALSKTGERLSSFNEYSNIESCTIQRKLKEKEVTPEANSQIKDAEIRKRCSNHRQRRKKGIAPPPPVPLINKLPDKNMLEGIKISNNNRQRNSFSCSSFPSSKKHETSVSKSNGTMTQPKTKKSPKKKRAPQPPVTSQTMCCSSKFHANFLPQSQKPGVLLHEKEKHLFHVTKQQTSSDVQDPYVEEEEGEEWEIVSLPRSFPRATSYFLNGQLFSGMEHVGLNKIGSKIHNLDSFRGSDEVRSVTAINKCKPNDKISVSEVVDPCRLKNDKCLKISIAKTEMNVFTVEEIQENVDQNSSFSELSEDDDDDDDGSDRNYQKLSNGLKSSSSEESLPPVETKPIFNELQIIPPAKASVKDFVEAFNMLADREQNNLNMKKNPTSTVHKIKTSVPQPTSKKCIKSFPTKWQYQQCVPCRDSYLLPIQEESHNDLLETEGNTHQTSGTLETVSKSSKSCSISKGKLEHYKDETAAPFVSTATKNIEAPSWKPKASAAALSSLLNPGSSMSSSCKGTKKKHSCHKIAKSADEQQIVVSLYIEDKSSHLGPLPYTVTPSMSLWKLKKKVEKEYNFDKDLQCWILGETFAIHDEAPLSSYGVVDSGCPILLYVMSMDSQTKSLPSRAKMKINYTDATHSSGSGEEYVQTSLDLEVGRSSKSFRAPIGEDKIQELSHAVKQLEKKLALGVLRTQSKTEDTSDGQNYHALVQLDDADLVTNKEGFECPICFLLVNPGSGVILQDCLHSFCKECLAGAIEYSETAVIRCPFRNDEYSCESHLLEREIKSLVSQKIFEQHLQRSVTLAESQAQDSFHCKSPDCPGWCLYEDNVNIFHCPVCKQLNCLTCGAIHVGKNCRQYQDDVASQCDSSEEAKKTKEYLENMLKDGDAMKCPKCAVILMKKWGCDWLKCSMCHTEVCWVTKGPRWGHGGRGDTSGGCKCMLNGVRCHPKCSYCH